MKKTNRNVHVTQATYWHMCKSCVTYLLTVYGRERQAFNVKVGEHPSSVLSPLLFISMLKALSRIQGMLTYRTALCG